MATHHLAQLVRILEIGPEAQVVGTPQDLRVVTAGDARGSARSADTSGARNSSSCAECNRPGPTEGTKAATTFVMSSAETRRSRAHARARRGGRATRARARGCAFMPAPAAWQPTHGSRRHRAPAHSDQARLRDDARGPRQPCERPPATAEQRPPAPAIIGAAASTDPTLIVLGSRPGTPAISVSAGVARDASCSVLVLRPGRLVGRPDAPSP